MAMMVVVMLLLLNTISRVGLGGMMVVHVRVGVRRRRTQLGCMAVGKFGGCCTRCIHGCYNLAVGGFTCLPAERLTIRADCLEFCLFHAKTGLSKTHPS